MVFIIFGLGCSISLLKTIFVALRKVFIKITNFGYRISKENCPKHVSTLLSLKCKDVIKVYVNEEVFGKRQHGQCNKYIIAPLSYQNKFAYLNNIDLTADYIVRLYFVFHQLNSQYSTWLIFSTLYSIRIFAEAFDFLEKNPDLKILTCEQYKR